MNKDTLVFEVEMGDDTKKLLASRPNLAQQRAGQNVYNRAWNDAVSSGTILTVELEPLLRKRGLWDDHKQTEMIRLTKEIMAMEKTLLKGGIKKSDGADIAFKIQDTKNELDELLSIRNSLNLNTAEGQAQNARFNFWVSTCVVYNDTKKPVFKDEDDYIQKSSFDYAVTCAEKLASLMYGLTEDQQKESVEFEFLRTYGYIDNQGRLINEDGKLVNKDGDLVDENGRRVNEDGDLVDFQGDVIDKEGEYSFKKQPFLDDDGNAIVLEDETEETEEVLETSNSDS